MESTSDFVVVGESFVENWQRAGNGLHLTCFLAKPDLRSARPKEPLFNALITTVGNFKLLTSDWQTPKMARELE